MCWDEHASSHRIEQRRGRGTPLERRHTFPKSVGNVSFQHPFQQGLLRYFKRKRSDRQCCQDDSKLRLMKMWKLSHGPNEFPEVFFLTVCTEAQIALTKAEVHECLYSEHSQCVEVRSPQRMWCSKSNPIIPLWGATCRRPLRCSSSKPPPHLAGWK